MLKVHCESYANPMIYPLIAYGITVVALTLVTRAVRQLLAIYKKGQPDPTRSTHKDERFKNMLKETLDRKSTRLNSSHIPLSRMPSSA